MHALNVLNNLPPPPPRYTSLVYALIGFVFHGTANTARPSKRNGRHRFVPPPSRLLLFRRHCFSFFRLKSHSQTAHSNPVTRFGVLVMVRFRFRTIQNDDNYRFPMRNKRAHFPRRYALFFLLLTPRVYRRTNNITLLHRTLSFCVFIRGTGSAG